MHRYIVYLLAILMFPICLWLATIWPAWYWGVGLTAAMVALGTWDLLQKRSTLRRNYPVMAHFRYGLESIGPEIRQYFVQSDLEDVPFSRQQRALIYQRAKNEMDTVPFGTLRSTYAVDYEWINHSLAPTSIAKHDFRVLIGPNCAKPYSASVFNISAMSFGSLSANAIRALNEGARRGGFYHDTGEGSISPYHREMGGDLVWEIGSGYFGCRDEKGGFSEERFVANATDDQVKMIEIKLSQGAKPGHGGVLPAPKVTAEISVTRGVPMGVDCVSPSRHSAFSTPVELLQFVARLRELSGGKPVGFKLAIGHPWNGSASPRRCRKPGCCRTSSWSMAPREAPARHRLNSSTMSACRCMKHCCWCTTPWSAWTCASASASVPLARSPVRSTSRAPSRWVPTGAMPAEASCSRWAASSR